MNWQARRQKKETNYAEVIFFTAGPPTVVFFVLHSTREKGPYVLSRASLGLEQPGIVKQLPRGLALFRQPLEHGPNKMKK